MFAVLAATEFAFDYSVYVGEVRNLPHTLEYRDTNHSFIAIKKANYSRGGDVTSAAPSTRLIKDEQRRIRTHKAWVNVIAEHSAVFGGRNRARRNRWA